MVMPELLQGEATPDAMAREVEHWLNAPQKVQSLQQRFEQLRHTLMRDPPTRVTDAIQTLLDR